MMNALRYFHGNCREISWLFVGSFVWCQLQRVLFTEDCDCYHCDMLWGVVLKKCFKIFTFTTIMTPCRKLSRVLSTRAVEKSVRNSRVSLNSIILSQHKHSPKLTASWIYSLIATGVMQREKQTGPLRWSLLTCTCIMHNNASLPSICSGGVTLLL